MPIIAKQLEDLMTKYTYEIQSVLEWNASSKRERNKNVRNKDEDHAI